MVVLFGSGSVPDNEKVRSAQQNFGCPKFVTLPSPNQEVKKVVSSPHCRCKYFQKM